MNDDNQNPVILFDGICNLCNGFVQFVIKRDREEKFRFASLQSEAAKQMLTKFNLPTKNFTTIVLVKDENIFLKSDAVLEIARELKGWKWICFFRKIIPRIVRNGMYDLIARNRYRFFGKREYCMVPAENQIKRFMD